MKNKNLLFRLGVIVFAIGCFWLSFTSATSFKLDTEKFMSATNSVNNIVPVHFVDNWNDFGGFLYLSDWDMIVQECPEDDPDYPDCNGETSEDTTWEVYDVYLGDETPAFECKRRVKWFYYNAERWERLRPIDEETWKNIQTGLTTEWWIYTVCRKAWYKEALEECECNPEDDENCNPEQYNEICVAEKDALFPRSKWYFGQLKHTYKNQDFGLIIWTEYNNTNSSWYNVSKDENGVKLSETFIRHLDRFPLGFIYDYNGWLWFAWCQINGGQDHQENKSETLGYLLDERNKGEAERKTIFVDNWKGWLSYKGNKGSSAVDCEKIWIAADSLLKLMIEWLIGMNRESDLWFIWNQYNSKMQYFSSSDINNATLLNYVKQRSEILCRGKWNKTDENLVCLNTDGGNSGDIDADAEAYKNKTLIVKGRNVIVKPATTANEQWNYDIFISNWDLVIDERDAEKFVFTTEWFISSLEQNIYGEGGYIKTLEWYYGGGENYKWNPYHLAGVWSFIRWNFIVDWHVKTNTSNNKLNNKYFIYWKFTTKDSMDDLEEIFAWRCKNWYVVNKAWIIQNSQGKYCPPSVTKINVITQEKEYEWYNPYEWASLVVIDQSYDSPLYW